MEESPTLTTALIRDFLEDRMPAVAQSVRSAEERRITPREFEFPNGTGAGTRKP
jgi:hypothetical protein